MAVTAISSAIFCKTAQININSQQYYAKHKAHKRALDDLLI